jgi:hypothetical protein
VKKIPFRKETLEGISNAILWNCGHRIKSKKK